MCYIPNKKIVRCLCLSLFCILPSHDWAQLWRWVRRGRRLTWWRERRRRSNRGWGVCMLMSKRCVLVNNNWQFNNNYACLLFNKSCDMYTSGCTCAACMPAVYPNCKSVESKFVHMHDWKWTEFPIKGLLVHSFDHLLICCTWLAHLFSQYMFFWKVFEFSWILINA